MENTYTIFIRNESGGGGSGSREANGNAPGKKKADGKKKDAFDSELVKILAQVWAVSAVVRQGVRAGADIVTRNTGNSYIRSVTNEAFSIAKVTMGSIMAGMINPVLGATYGLSSVVNIGFQDEQASWDRRWENENLYRLRERAGVSFNRSRRRI